MVESSSESFRKNQLVINPYKLDTYLNTTKTTNNTNSMKNPATTAYIAASEYAGMPTDHLGRRYNYAAHYSHGIPAIVAAANALRDAARNVWLSSDEPREWRVGGDSWCGAMAPDTISDFCPSDIEEKLGDDCRNGAWESDETMWFRDWACPIDPVTDEPVKGERVVVTTTIEVDEPSCEKSEHDWQSPEMLGGLSENPGVIGNGGGVIVTEVCGHCGKYRVTDTWAQDRTTGEQGLTSIKYEDADEKSETWMAEGGQ